MDINEIVASVNSREEFISFLDAFLNDLRRNPTEWENSTLDSYLEAMKAWVEDSDGYYSDKGQTLPQAPSWRTIAEILISSKYYE